MKAESPSKSSKAAKMKKLTEENFERFRASAKSINQLQVCKTSKDNGVCIDEASDVQNKNCIDDTREVEHSSKGHTETPKEHEVEFTNSESENCSKQCTTDPEEKSNSSQSSSESINNSNEKSCDKNSEIEGLNPKQHTANGDQADGKENTTKDDAASDSELPTFRHSINKTFYLDLTDEVGYVRKFLVVSYKKRYF